MVDPALIRARFASVSPHLDERGRRLLAASEARAAGHGGIVAVWRATGLAPSTIGRGLRELAGGAVLAGGFVRQPGGGRKALAASDPGLLGALLALVLPSERGDPMSPLRWTCKSLRRLADELPAQGPPGQPHGGGRAAARRGLQPASQPDDPGGEQPSRLRHASVTVTRSSPTSNREVRRTLPRTCQWRWLGASR